MFFLIASFGYFMVDFDWKVGFCTASFGARWFVKRICLIPGLIIMTVSCMQMMLIGLVLHDTSFRYYPVVGWFVSFSLVAAINSRFWNIYAPAKWMFCLYRKSNFVYSYVLSSLPTRSLRLLAKWACGFLSVQEERAVAFCYGCQMVLHC